MQKLSLFSLGTLVLFSASLSFAAEEPSILERFVKHEVKAVEQTPEIPVWRHEDLPKNTLALFENYNSHVLFVAATHSNRPDLWVRWTYKPNKPPLTGFEQWPMEKEGDQVLFKRYKTEDGRIFFLERFDRL